jgi:hypothetical protein
MGEGPRGTAALFLRLVGGGGVGLGGGGGLAGVEVEVLGGAD